MNKKTPNMQEDIDAYNKALLNSKQYAEVEKLHLENNLLRLNGVKNENEIKILQNKLKDYQLTRFVAWIGAILAIGEIVKEIIKFFK